MRIMRRVAVTGTVLALVGATAGTADARLCVKKSGALFLRNACRNKETTVSLAELQARVAGTCAAGTAMTAIAADGTVTCTPAGVFAYGQVRPDGALRSSSANVAQVTRVETGKYCVTFSNAPASDKELEGAVASLAGDESSGAAFVRVVNGQGNFVCTGLAIGATDAAGVYVDARFSFVVP